MQVNNDSLTVNGSELLDSTNASPENTTIALFLYDVNQDGQEDSSAPLFDQFPFLAARDTVFDSNESLTFSLNGREVTLPYLAASEAVLVVVFN